MVTNISHLTDTNNNKLNLVNKCLRAIGNTELPSGTNPNTVAEGTVYARASTLVDEVAMVVLNAGWHFNTDYQYELVPDGTTGFITVPNSVLRIDSTRYKNYTLRGDKVYDNTNNTFIFTDNIKVNLIWVVSYSDLSVAASHYIGNRAAREFYEIMIGAPQETSYIIKNEQDAYNELMREQAQTIDASLLDYQVSYRWANPYKGL